MPCHCVGVVAILNARISQGPSWKKNLPPFQEKLYGHEKSQNHHRYSTRIEGAREQEISNKNEKDNKIIFFAKFITIVIDTARD